MNLAAKRESVRAIATAAVFTIAQAYRPAAMPELGPARLVEGVKTPLDLTLLA